MSFFLYESLCSLTAILNVYSDVSTLYCLANYHEYVTSRTALRNRGLFFQKKCSIKNVYRVLHGFYGAHNRPSESTVNNVFLVGRMCQQQN